jgi:uracil-DNA glycosylase family 4
VAWREEVARVRTRRHRDQEYWGRPVPGFGDPSARVLLVGLAPAAHGGNRTGRIFTGDPSGDFLFPALHRAGFASQPQSVSRDDGMRLEDLYVAAAARCAPPQNRPDPLELASCFEYLAREWACLRELRVVACLGAIGHDAALRVLAARGVPLVRARHRFAHGAVHRFEGGPVIVDSYHVSRQNTNTGRLTPAMLDAVLRTVREEARR